MYTSLCLRSKASLAQLCEDFDDYLSAGSTTTDTTTTISPPTWSRQLADTILPLETLHTTITDSMAHRRALTTPDLQNYYSTASAPSMRAREPITEEMQRPFTPPDADGGNVKVVLRVRKFIKRGEA